MAIKRAGRDTIVCAAVEIASAEDRAAYIAQACGGDHELRQQVEKLVDAHFRSPGFLESPAAALVATIDEPISERPGTVIGPYKLMEQIGEGGMGLVFVAEQQRPVRRKVAFKVIKPGMDTRQVVARFEAERQALALMDHSNIAKVLDGGETTSGRPYFVMELVKGVPITEYCDQNQLTPRERLELFLHVCQAIQHAHQKGIIHRDIKPSNVLVVSHDGMPVVKVIDFGVAKAVGQQLTDKTIYTQFAQLVGTPLYMSPEQAGQSSLDVDTRTDIYALGVLLYELLTGKTPLDRYRFKQAAYDEICRIIREEEPPKPSTRISTMGKAASTVSTQLRDALKANDQKALLGLAASADVARLPTQTLVLLGRTLAGFAPEQAVVLLRQAHWQYPGDLWINDSLDWLCLVVLRPVQLDEAVRYYTATLALRPRNPYMMNQLAIALQGKGALNEALAAYGKAIEWKPDFWGPWVGRGATYLKLDQPDKALAQYSHVIEQDPKNAWAWNERAWAYGELKQWDKALADHAKAIELDPKNATLWVYRAHAYVALGQWDNALADANKAIELNPKLAGGWDHRGDVFAHWEQYDKALADYSKAIELDPGFAWHWSDRASIYIKLGQWDKGMADHNKAIELDPHLAAVWNNRGHAYLSMNEWDKALADLSKAILLDPKGHWQWNNRGVVYARLMQWDRAVADLSRAVELGPDSPNAQNHLAWLLATHPDPAKRDPRRAVALAEAAVKGEPSHGALWTTLGAARYRAGDAPGAVAALQEALKRCEGVSDFQPGAGRSLFFLAMAQQKAGHAREARQAYERAQAWLKTNKQALEKNSWAADEMRRFQTEAEEVLEVTKARFPGVP